MPDHRPAHMTTSLLNMPTEPFLGAGAALLGHAGLPTPAASGSPSARPRSRWSTTCRMLLLGSRT